MDKDTLIDRTLVTVYGNAVFGKFNTQAIGRAYRPGLWHLMQSDPCDQPNPRELMGWKWLEPNNDPCDEWPVIQVGGEFVGFISSFEITNNG